MGKIKKHKDWSIAQSVTGGLFVLRIEDGEGIETLWTTKEQLVDLKEFLAGFSFEDFETLPE